MTLPEQMEEEPTEEFLQTLHHVLLEVHLIDSCLYNQLITSRLELFLAKCSVKGAAMFSRLKTRFQICS